MPPTELPKVAPEKNDTMEKTYFVPLRITATLTIAALIALLLLAGPPAHAQSCPFRPADCPDKDYATADRAEDSADRVSNPLVPQEVTMEYRLRALTGDFVRRLAAQQHWEEPVELNEWGSSGFRAADESVLAYPLRPPHSFSITWELIVNKDSLHSWTGWTEDFLKRSLALVDQYKQAASAQTGSASGGSAPGSSMASIASGLEHLPLERKARTLQFRDATLLLIEFDFNADRADPVEEASPAGSYTIPGCALARQFYRADPDILEAINTYAHSRNTALVLIGGWNTRLTANGYSGYYESPFYTDKKARDRTSPKKIPCDRVQGLHVWLSGNRSAMQKLLSGSSFTPLQQWITSAYSM
jgi:hypothetical protein